MKIIKEQRVEATHVTLNDVEFTRMTNESFGVFWYSMEEWGSFRAVSLELALELDKAYKLTLERIEEKKYEKYKRT